MKLPLLRCLALVLGLLLRLVPAHAQVLRGTFAAGDVHSLSIHADGTLWATGSNFLGQLGIPLTTVRSSTWVQVGTATNWVQVAVGYSHSLGLRADGTLWAWGSNRSGQLANATNINTDNANPLPTQVGTERYTQVAAGGSHSLALRADGTLWAWGLNLWGQLGNAANVQTNTPNPVPTQVGTARYTQLAGGSSHSLALRADGTLWAWGWNFYGQLGSALNAGPGSSSFNPVPAQVGTERYTQVVAGGYHSLGLRPDGTLWAWGDNTTGQLGNAINMGPGSSSPNPVPAQVGTQRYTQMAAGGYHSLGLRPDGTLWAWGRNDYGQLGNLTNSGNDTPNPNPTRVGNERYAQAVAGNYHGLGLRADGTLFAWGLNDFGQLGSPSNANTTTPNPSPTDTGTALPTRSTAAGANFGLAVRADGTLWAWGDNRYGQLGDGTTTTSLQPKQVGTDRDWVQAVAGGYHSLGLKADGTLWAWGVNTHGELGNTTNTGSPRANPTPTRVGTDLYTLVAAGFSHSLGLRADGTLYAWGYNYFGQLGNATTSRSTTANPTPAQVGTDLYTQITGGGYYSLALRPGGTLWAWGVNYNGELGNAANNGNDNANPTPAQVGSALYCRMAAGFSHGLGLRPDGTLYAWGRNDYGQLGQGTSTSTNVANPTLTQVTGTYTLVAAGESHSLGLRANGTLYTWGHNDYGQLGQGTTGGNSLTPGPEATAGTWASLAPGASSSSSVVRTASGLSFASAGYNYVGQLGDGTLTSANRFDRLHLLGPAQPLPVLAAGSPGSGLRLYPNPTAGHATALHGATPGAAVLVLDALGRPVLAATADATGTAQLRLPAGLAAGVYLVRAGSQARRLSVE